MKFKNHGTRADIIKKNEEKIFAISVVDFFDLIFIIIWHDF
jgi:hypothetical protein